MGVQGRDGQLAICIRRAGASMCSVEPELLCAQDDSSHLYKSIKGWKSLDRVEFVMALEDSFGDDDVPVYAPNLERISPIVEGHFFGVRKEAPANFGDWVTCCVKLLAVR